MHSLDLSAISDADKRACEAIAADAGVNLKDCYQCGKCTAGCPLADSMDLMPREVIRYLQLGAIDVVLDAKTPWICAQCVVCSSRCPQNVDICSVMRAVRLTSKAAGKRPLPEADIFDDEFIANVRAHGVSNEQYLAAAYNVKSGHLLQDMGNATRIGLAVHALVAELMLAAQETGPIAEDDPVRLSTAYIEQHFAEKVSVDDLARVAAVSPSYLIRLFKRQMGTTPHDYLLRYRISRAKELLAETTLPSAAIAVQVGFASESNFSYRFKQMVGQGPRAYRLSSPELVLDS